MQSTVPVSIETRALGTLAYIRTSIEMSGSMVVPGTAGVVMGSIGVLAAIARCDASVGPALAVDLGARRRHRVPGRRRAHGARRPPRRGHARYLGPVRKFLLCLCPALLAGAVLTFVLWHAALESLLPGTWLLLYGCAVLSASTVTIASTMRLICIMGALFVVLGSVAFALPPAAHTAVLGAGFGALHIVFGLLLGVCAMPTRSLAAKRNESAADLTRSRRRPRPVPVAQHAGDERQFRIRPSDL